MNKITLIICEGPSDRRALSPLFPQSEYVIVFGDFITGTDLLNHPQITEQNITMELTKWIINEIAKLNIKTKLNLKDIANIMYITDSDNCFEMNNLKSRVLKKLAKTGELTLKKQSKTFKLLVFSNDLEEVFIGESKKSFNSNEERRIYKIAMAKKINEEYTSNGFNYTIGKLNSFGILPYSSYKQFRKEPDLLKGRATNLNIIL